MDLLSRLEHALEGMVEGVFSRAFRAPLQPIEIAKRLTREVENHRSVSVHATYVPNIYIVGLSPDTYASFEPISGRLLGELEQYLREFTAERGYDTVGPIAVRLQEDATVKPGDMQVTVASDAQAAPSAVAPPATLRSYPTAGQRPPQGEQDRTMLITAAPTELEIVTGEGVGRQVPLQEGLTIGRGVENRLPLADPGASRRHAEIVWEDEGWVLRDLGSTNGTFVNNRRITTHALHVGETVQIGQTSFRVK